MVNDKRHRYKGLDSRSTEVFQKTEHVFPIPIMKSIVSTVLAVICLLSPIFSVDSTEIGDFIFLGTRSPSSSKSKAGALDFHASLYYVNPNVGLWTTAVSECADLFGPGGHLVSIESAEEDLWLNYFLEYNVPGARTYWTSGRFISGEWRWGATNTAIDYTSWGPSQPPPTITTQSRISMKHISEYESAWSSDMATMTRSYICEVDTKAPLLPENDCNAFTTATDCLSASLGCAFCHVEEFEKSRCDTLENLNLHGCVGKFRCPAPILPAISVDLDHLHDPIVLEDSTLCPEETKTFNVTIRIEDVPLDLYFLGDFSGSMNDDRNNLIGLSSELSSVVQSISSSSRLGFGSFVDKPNSPFGTGSDYSFRNNLALTHDTSLFEEAVKNQAILHGNDGPESQLDGLFQSAACVDEIGWRSNARRIIILLTDAEYHVAGHGIPYGLLPFNGNCSLDAGGKYDMESYFDYPSEEQTIEIIRANNIVPIFAVTSSAQYSYSSLNERIKPSALGTLSSDSSNIISLLKDQYGEIANRVEIGRSDDGSVIGLSVKSTCNGGVEMETNVCEDIGKFKDVTFTIDMSIVECPTTEGALEQTVRIGAVGLPMFFDVPLKVVC